MRRGYEQDRPGRSQSRGIRTAWGALAAAVMLLLAQMASAQCPEAIGPRFQVNTFTSGSQFLPRAGADAFGNSVVVWSSEDLDGSGDAVVGRRVSSTGMPIGSEFQINSYTPDDQSYPDVAVSPNGDFVVVWQSGDTLGIGGSQVDVRGQRFASTGLPTGGEFTVSTFTVSGSNLAAVAKLDDGRFVVSWMQWSGNASSGHVFARRYDSSGALGAAFLVNSYTDTSTPKSGVAMDGSGAFVVVWSSDYSDGDADAVLGRRFDSAGSPIGSEPFLINSYTEGNQQFPDVAGLADGRFVVAWTSDTASSSVDRVAAQRYASDGTPFGSEFTVNQSADSSQFPEVALAQNGDITVSWMSGSVLGSLGNEVRARRFPSFGASACDEVMAPTREGCPPIRYRADIAGSPDDSFVLVSQGMPPGAPTNLLNPDGTGIFAQRYDSTGMPAGSEQMVNTAPGDQDSPTVTRLLSGQFAVVWNIDGRDGDSEGVFARRLDSTGVPLGTEFQVNTHTLSAQAYPQVATASDGGFLVVWESSSQDGSSDGVFARRFDSAGAALGSEIQVNTYTSGDQNQPALVSTGTQFVVTWNSAGQDGSANGIFGRRLDSAGAPLGGEFQVSSYTVDSDSFPSVADTGVGSFVALWTRIGPNTDGDASGIFAQRFDSAAMPVGSEFQVNTYTVGQQVLTGATGFGDGTFVAAWSTGAAFSTTQLDIAAQRFDSSGAPVGSEFQVNTYTTSLNLLPSIAPFGGGEFVIAWSSLAPTVLPIASAAIHARRFDAAGAPLGDEIGGEPCLELQAFPSVSTGPDRFLLVWNEIDLGNLSPFFQDAEVFAQLYGPANTETPTPTPSSTPTNTPTSTPTQTPTSTPTRTPTTTPTQAPNGADCSIPSQCQSGFCADGVCCNQACTGPGEDCSAPTPGVCTVVYQPAPAPSLTPTGLAAALAVLLALGALALRRRAR